MQTIEISAAEMASHIARFDRQESQSAHYAEAAGIPREAYEIMAAKTLYLMMAPASQGGPMAQRPAVVGDSGLSVIIARCPPGDKPLLHAHHYTVETFMCLTGRFRIRWGSKGDQHIDLEPHDMIAVPPGVDRQFENITDEEALLLVIISGSGDKDFADISMPPAETAMIRERFGQSTIDGYNKIGVAFRNADGKVDGPQVPAPIEVSGAEMATRIARLSDMQPLSVTSGESIGVPREARELVAAKSLYLLMAPQNQGGPMAHHAAIAGPDNVSVLIADLAPFDMIAVPPGVDRQFENISDDDARLLVIITGASRDDYNDISLPPDATELIRNRFGQGVIDAYGQRGVTFREG